jgi:hypothetical protein
MTRRKDPRPEADASPTDPVAVVVDPVDAPDTEAPIPDAVAEPAPDPVPDPAPDPVRIPPAPPPPTARQSGLFASLAGGALAALGGFALAHYNLLGLAAPDNDNAVAALSASLEDAQSRQSAALEGISGEIAALSDRIAALESAPPPEPPDLSRLDDLDQRLAAIEAMPNDGTAASTALTAKVAELDRRLSALPTAGSEAEVKRQLDEALARLDAAEAEAASRADEAAAAAAAARRAAALDALTSVATDGRPFAAELSAIDDPALSTALGPFADGGVPTLATLQADFPAAARDSLRVARQISAEDGWSDRLFDFLAAQTGARSLTPREGSTPDAILSRAEFAVSEARVADALAELDLLDPAVKAPLAAWMTAAEGHVAAMTALRAARGE